MLELSVIWKRARFRGQLLSLLLVTLELLAAVWPV